MVSQRVVRPVSVTVVVALTWVNAVLHLVGGALALALGGVLFGGAAGREVGSGVAVTVLGVITVALGVVTAVLAVHLARGGQGSRVLITLAQTLTIGLNIGSWLAADLPERAAQAGISIMISVVIIALLWNRRADSFFAAHP